MNNLIPSEDGVPVGFTFEDCRWLSKNGIDYRDYHLTQALRDKYRRYLPE